MPLCDLGWDLLSVFGQLAPRGAVSTCVACSAAVERARTVVEGMVEKKRPRDSSKDLPFSRDAKKIFETALLVRAGCTRCLPACLKGCDSNWGGGW